MILSDRIQAVYGSGLGLTHKAVMQSLAFHADADTLETWVGWERIATDVGCDRSTVIRAMGELEAGGAFTRQTRPGRAPLYTLRLGNLPGPEDDRHPLHRATRGRTPPVAESHPTRGAAPPPPVAESHPTRGAAPPEPVREPVTQPVREPVMACAPPREAPPPPAPVLLFATPPAAPSPKPDDPLTLWLVYRQLRLDLPLIDIPGRKAKPHLGLTPTADTRKALRRILAECGGLDRAGVYLAWVCQSQDHAARRLRGEARWPDGVLELRVGVESLSRHIPDRIGEADAWEARGRTATQARASPDPTTRAAPRMSPADSHAAALAILEAEERGDPQPRPDSIDVPFAEVAP